jgi:selenocysteine lyase/cysteine desulfurase
MTLKQSIDWKNEWFPIEHATYLNFAAHAAIPRVALNAVQASVAAKSRPHIVDDQSFFSVARSLRQSLATLIGASQEDIALTSGAGAGLATIAYALKWSAGDEVIIAGGEFPAHYATWKPMEAREGIKVQITHPQGQFIQSGDLIAAMTPRTRVISVSHVRFDDGSILDASSLAAACKNNGTLLVLDVSQSCGAIPMDVRSLGADFIVCAGYKYLLGPFGTGFLWAKPQNADLLRPGPYKMSSRRLSSINRYPGTTWASVSRHGLLGVGSLKQLPKPVFQQPARHRHPVALRHWREILREGLQPEPAEPAVGLRSARPSL